MGAKEELLVSGPSLSYDQRRVAYDQSERFDAYSALIATGLGHSKPRERQRLASGYRAERGIKTRLACN